jgi:hypothetical protein
MIDQTNLTPIQSAWSAFAETMPGLFVPQPDERPLDQYLAFRDRVLTLIRSEEFVLGLAIPMPASASDEALLEELKAFPRAVEVARAVESTTTESAPWWRRWVGRAGTVAGSVKDLLANAPPLVKNGLTLFKELADLFKG